jgi:hypothetical protein
MACLLLFSPSNLGSLFLVYTYSYCIIRLDFPPTILKHLLIYFTLLFSYKYVVPSTPIMPLKIAVVVLFESILQLSLHAFNRKVLIKAEC